MRRGRRNGFRLTAQRKAILKRLTQYRYLRTSHFYALSGAGRSVSARAVRRLLRDFWECGCLARRIVVADVSREPLPRYEYVYWLSRAGVALARDCGFCDDEFLTAPRPSHRTLAHDAAITEVHLGVERFCRTHGWRFYWRQHGLKHGVNPDALFALTDPGRPPDASTSYYFLELERSGEGGYRKGRSGLLRRLHRYAAYQGSAACRRDWAWFDEFRVVIVVASEARRKNLLARLAADLPLPMFWLAVEGSDLSGPAFRTPCDYEERAYSFLD
jgi:hypothetical protein